MTRAARKRSAAPGISFLAGALLLAVAAGSGWAQTPTTPPAESGQEQQGAQPTQPAPAETQQQVPLQQYPIQTPGRPPLTPATPPSTTLPPWTPPTPPPPSQTNIPAPFPYGTPGAPGAPSPAGGIPGLTLPGAFAPTVVAVRGALLEFHPTARLSQEYTDNFFQTTSRTQENFRTILGPGFRMLLNGARTFGTFSTVVDLAHDTAPNSGDDIKVLPSANLAVRYALTPRLSLTFSDTFVRTDQPGFSDQFGLRSGRRTYYTNAATATVDWLLGPVATQAYYRNVLFVNEDDAQGVGGGTRNDSMTHILGLNASTRVLTDYVVRGGYEFSASDEINGSSAGAGQDQDTSSHTVFGSVARQFGLFTSAGVSGSYQAQTNDDTTIWNTSLFGAYGLPNGVSLSGAVGYSVLNSDTRDNEGTVSFNVNAGYRFARAFFSVGVFQDFRQTAQQGENFGTVQTRSYFGSFLYQFTPFINSTLHVTYSENEPTGTGNTDTGGTQTALSYGAGINWQILRWLSANLDYTYTKHTGQNAFAGGATSGDFAENRVILSLFATF